MCAHQIPLTLPIEPSMGEDDFMMTPSNSLAVAKLDQHSAVLLLGPKGSGKSHLARIWQKRHNAISIDPDNVDIATLTTALVWDDADQTPWNTQTQETAFHMLNTAREKQMPLLITATVSPNTWPITLADLRSRLLALPVAQIDTPDDTLVAGLLLKHFNDRQLRISEDVLSYILARIARDGFIIEQTVKQLDEHSLAHNRAITIPLVKTVLGTA